MPGVKVLQYDADAQEAVVEIETSLDESVPASRTSFIAFDPQGISSVMNPQISLFALLVTNIVFEEGLQAPVKTNSGYFSYHLFAKVTDAESNRVQLGDIDIVLDCPIPRDISPNSVVSFDVMRLDLQC